MTDRRGRGRNVIAIGAGAVIGSTAYAIVAGIIEDPRRGVAIVACFVILAVGLVIERWTR